MGRVDRRDRRDFIVADRFTVAGLGEDIATNVGLQLPARLLCSAPDSSPSRPGVVTVVVGNLPFLGLIVRCCR